jgi:hypothetical protein
MHCCCLSMLDSYAIRITVTRPSLGSRKSSRAIPFNILPVQLCQVSRKSEALSRHGSLAVSTNSSAHQHPFGFLIDRIVDILCVSLCVWVCEAET